MSETLTGTQMASNQVITIVRCVGVAVLLSAWSRRLSTLIVSVLLPKPVAPLWAELKGPRPRIRPPIRPSPRVQFGIDGSVPADQPV